jgi:hypothetical protein
MILIKMKTRKQHLQKLPLQKRLQAMEAIRRNNLFVHGLSYTMNMRCHNEVALAGCFTFHETRQGHTYWWSIQEKYFSE